MPYNCFISTVKKKNPSCLKALQQLQQDAIIFHGGRETDIGGRSEKKNLLMVQKSYFFTFIVEKFSCKVGARLLDSFYAEVQEVSALKEDHHQKT